MRKKRCLKIISIVLILVLICVSITYVKRGNKEVIATTKEFNSENLQNNEHMHVELDNSGDKVPVPNGYVGSKVAGENEIDTGYVIYEGTEEVNDSNVEEAQKTRNQYVWIPVPDASIMYGTDENGKKWGKLYNFATSSNDPNYDELTGAYPLNWSESDGEMQVINMTNAREPDIVKGFDGDNKLKMLDKHIKGTHDFLLYLEQDFNSMIKSVEKYKGFYIGRYETGDLSKETAVVIKGNSDIGSQTWYTMYNKCKKLSNENENIETGIIWGSQRDRILMWLIESGDKEKTDIAISSINWGNYKDSEFEYLDSNDEKVLKSKNSEVRIPTGSAEVTKANNIYDLAGNVSDLTMSVSNRLYKQYRGGNYQDKENAEIVTASLGAYSYQASKYMRMPSNVIYKVNKR